MKRDNRYVSKETLYEVNAWKTKVHLYGKWITEITNKGKRVDKDFLRRYYFCMKYLHYWLSKANKEYFKNIGRS